MAAEPGMRGEGAAPEAGPGEARSLGVLIAEGHALLREERAILSEARFGAMQRIITEKERLLADLDRAIEDARRPPPPGVAEGLTGLIEESRRNERLIAAARAGLATARRRIEAILATRRGAVAYAPDGSPITARADGERHRSGA